MIQVPVYLDQVGDVPEVLAIIALAAYFILLGDIWKRTRLAGRGLLSGMRWGAFLRDAVIVGSCLMAALVVGGTVVVNLPSPSFWHLWVLLTIGVVPGFVAVAWLGDSPRGDHLHLLIGGVWAASVALVILGRLGMLFWINLLWPLMIGAVAGTWLYGLLSPRGADTDD